MSRCQRICLSSTVPGSLSFSPDFLDCQSMDTRYCNVWYWGVEKFTRESGITINVLNTMAQLWNDSHRVKKVFRSPELAIDFESKTQKARTMVYSRQLHAPKPSNDRNASSSFKKAARSSSSPHPSSLAPDPHPHPASPTTPSAPPTAH